MILACCLALYTKSSLHPTQWKVSHDNARKGELWSCSLRVHVVAFYVPQQILCYWLRAESIWSAALSKGWFCFFLFPFSSLSRSHRQARQDGCPEWGLHPHLCAIYFYRNYALTLTLGPSLIWSWALPILFFSNEKFL